MKDSEYTQVPDLGAVGALGRELFKLLSPNSEALHCSMRRKLILLITPEQPGGVRSGLMITRVNASTLDCRSIAVAGAAPEKEGERIVALEGSDGFRFHFRKRLLAPHDLASELIEIASGKRDGKR